MIGIRFRKKDSVGNAVTGLGTVVRILSAGISGITLADLTEIKKDAANSATSASTSATKAANSASAAKSSESIVAASASAAKLSETSAANSSASAFNSKNSAGASSMQAQQFASTASAEAMAAKTSATASAASAAAAKASADKAKVSEDNAKLSETGAANSAAIAQSSESVVAANVAAAKTSETNAASSAQASAASATTSADHAAKASSSETKAGISETNAGLSEAAAKLSETKSKASEAASANSAADASASKDAAHTSEVNAEGFANAAKASKDAVDLSVIAVNASAVKAKTSEDNAKLSETNAANSAAQALASKNAAASSESNSATSATSASNSKVAAEAAETKTSTSEANAKSSETNARNSATNSAASASASADSATAADISETNAKASEVAAANSAVAADASADRAEVAAGAAGGGMIDGGGADLSSNTYPKPIVIQGIARSSIWKVTVGGTVNGVDFAPDDALMYSVPLTSYYKIDNTFISEVLSINGEKGHVTLNAADVGALGLHAIADAAAKWETARTITLAGAVKGSASMDGSANVTITTTMAPGTIPEATMSVKGIVQLSNAIDSTSTTLAATPSAVKQAYDKAYSKAETDAKYQVTGSYAPLKHSHDAADIVSGTINAARLPNASTTAKGIVTTTNSYTLNSVNVVASGKALVDGLSSRLKTHGVAVHYPTSGATIDAPSGVNDFQINQQHASLGDAMMTFHISGRFAAHFGIDRATSKWCVGGWSMGANKYALYHEGNPQKTVKSSYVNDANFTINVDDGHEEWRVTRWSNGTHTCTIIGQASLGRKVVLTNFLATSGKLTITHTSNIFAPTGIGSTTHTFTGGGQVELVGNGANFFVTRITGVK